MFTHDYRRWAEQVRHVHHLYPCKMMLSRFFNLGCFLIVITWTLRSRFNKTDSEKTTGLGDYMYSVWADPQVDPEDGKVTTTTNFTMCFKDNFSCRSLAPVWKNLNGG